jgi:hypothetical protein
MGVPKESLHYMWCTSLVVGCRVLEVVDPRLLHASTGRVSTLLNSINKEHISKFPRRRIYRRRPCHSSWRQMIPLTPFSRSDVLLDSQQPS